MLYTGALKSRQSLHMTADLDPTEVKDHINNHPLKHLNKDGTDSGNPVDIIKGDVHINRTYGERYQWREGVDFNYGLNATYNVGQQYTENHADDSQNITQSYDIPGLDAAESSAAGNVDDAVQAGLEEERKAGLVANSLAAVQESFLGAKVATHSGPIIENKQGQMIKNKLSVQDITSISMDKPLTKIEKSKFTFNWLNHEKKYSHHNFNWCNSSSYSNWKPIFNRSISMGPFN